MLNRSIVILMSVLVLLAAVSVRASKPTLRFQWVAQSDGQLWTDDSQWTSEEIWEETPYYYHISSGNAAYGPYITEGMDLTENIGVLTVGMTVTMTGGTIYVWGEGNVHGGLSLNGTWDMSGGLFENQSSSTRVSIGRSGRLLLRGGIFRVEKSRISGAYGPGSLGYGRITIDVEAVEPVIDISGGKLVVAGDVRPEAHPSMLYEYIRDGLITVDGARVNPNEALVLCNEDGTVGAGTEWTTVVGPMFEFETAESGDFENSSPAVVNVVLTTPMQKTVMVDYAVTGGTASRGIDYVLEDGTLTFEAGEILKSISIDIIDDGLNEKDETIIIGLSNPRGAFVNLAEQSEHTYTIGDLRPVVSFEESESVIPQNTRSPAEVAVVLSHPFTRTVKVDYLATTEGTATNGSDFTLEPGTLVFAPGEIRKAVSIAIIDDQNYEAIDETVVVKISNWMYQNDSRMGKIEEHTLTISDPRVQAGFESSASELSEMGGTVTVEVLLSGPTGDTVTVDYSVTGGTATRDVDYTLADGSFTFAPGETGKKLYINVIEDGLGDGEGDETIVLGLSNLSGELVTLGEGQYTHTILDQVFQTDFIKVDLALPREGQYTSGGMPLPMDQVLTESGTAKAGWSIWASPRWYDMYRHDSVTFEDIGGTGVSAKIGLVYDGDGGLKAAGMTMCSLAGDCAPNGTASFDPICNTWFQAIDWAEYKWGTILLTLRGLPPGEYWLHSYHNYFDCYRSGGGVACDSTSVQQPNMPSVTVMSLVEAEGLMDTLDPENGDDVYNHYPYADVSQLVDVGCGGVEMLEGAYDVPIQQVTSDSELVPSVVRFRTDGSSTVLIVYENGCCVTDTVRPGRQGGRAILNAFQLDIVKPADSAMPVTPCDGDDDAPINSILQWAPTPLAASYDVYLGTNSASVAAATPASREYSGTYQRGIETYIPEDPLAMGVTYYWRVDEVNDTNVWKSPVFSFTVMPCKVIDDFEIQSKTPAPTWEGFGGAAGGVTRACTCGESIYSPGVSMPDGCDYRYPGDSVCRLHHYSINKVLEIPYYHRSGWDPYSEACKTFNDPQNFAITGAKTLGFKFRGVSGNEPDRMYVVLEDQTGAGAEAAYEGPNEDLQSLTWLNAEFELNDFAGIDMANIKKLYIGAGDRGGSPSGSLGWLYIEDIGLCGDGTLPSCQCPGDLNTDGQVDLDDLQAVAGILLNAGSPFIVQVDQTHCGDLNGDLQADLDDLQAVAGILLNAGSPFIVPCE